MILNKMLQSANVSDMIANPNIWLILQLEYKMVQFQLQMHQHLKKHKDNYNLQSMLYSATRVANW